MPAEEFSVVGKRVPDVSGAEKVTGAAKFVSDICLPGMLIGKVLHSPYAHARVVSIDTSKTEKLPGVVAVVTSKDTPKKPYCENLSVFQVHSPEEIGGAFDQYIMEDHIHYAGQAVAGVAAISEKVAEEALELINVKYEVLPAVFNETEAVKDGAPQVHEFVQRWHNGVPKMEAVERNMAGFAVMPPLGDVEQGLRDADYVIDESGNTSKQKHASLETFSCVASFDARSRLTLWTQTQFPFFLRKMISYIFDIPEGMVRVRSDYIGGAFGAGLCVCKEPICIVLAQKSGKPVKLVYTRQEDFTDRPSRTEFAYRLRMGVKRDGTITATDREVLCKAGAHSESSINAALVGMGAAGSLYRRLSSRARADAIYTNKIPCGAMRGFGNPEETFVREQVMDEAAEKLGMDPLEFRLRNLCKVGEPGVFGPNFPITSTAMAECIKIGAEKVGWKEKHGRKQTETRRRGVGVSCMSHGASAFPVYIEHSNALIKFNDDASIILTVFPPPIGTNSTTSLAQIAAEVLNIPCEEVHVIWGDTDVTLFETGSYASRTAYVVGNAVKEAALEAKRKLLNLASKKLGVTADELELKDKILYVKANPQKQVPASQIIKEALYAFGNVEHITGSCSFRPRVSPPGYQAAFADIEVDTETGEVQISRLVIANDSGRMINPMIVEGQLQGAALLCLGYALWEEPMMDDKTGRILTDDFDTYKIATTLDMPEMELITIEQPDPAGPFGAKGAGEQGGINMAAAVANAIYDAVGVRLWELPLTPEKVLKALKSVRG
ncbi:MAG: molybdopterin-dependent oxidoreductase [Dehalococcoidia bacterium]|nr:molybdopterin-dependent oxidoreductase [Dehalococcoidia bacterium]